MDHGTPGRAFARRRNRPLVRPRRLWNVTYYSSDAMAPRTHAWCLVAAATNVLIRPIKNRQSRSSSANRFPDQVSRDTWRREPLPTPARASTHSSAGPLLQQSHASAPPRKLAVVNVRRRPSGPAHERQPNPQGLGAYIRLQGRIRGDRCNAFAPHRSVSA